MAAESMGILSDMFLVSLVRVLTSRGSISLYAGISKTSSKVSPSPKSRELLFAEMERVSFVAMCKDSARFKLLPN